MTHRRTLCLLLCLAGCTVVPTVDPTAPALDAGTDAGPPADATVTDTGTTVDGASTDASTDATADSALDASAEDASTDADAATVTDAGAPPVALCAKAFSNPGSATGVATDAAGNAFVVGHFNGTLNLGGGTLTTPAEPAHMFVAKFDNACNHVWSKQFGNSTGPQFATAVATDAAGNVFVTGSLNGDVNFGGGTLAGGAGNVFVVKLDTTGSHLWSKQFGAGTGAALATDASGNVSLIGYSSGAVDFGGGALPNAGAQRAIFARLSGAGGHIYSTRFGTAGAVGLGVSTDAAGASFLVGSFFNGTLTFGGSSHSNPGGNADMFFAKRDATGAHVFSQAYRDNAGADLVESAASVTTMSTGDVVVAGRAMGAVNVGGGVLAAGGSSDLIVASYTGAGAHVWSKRFGIASETHPAAIRADSLNNLIIAGTLAGSADFGGGTLTTAGSTDAFIVKLSSTGTHVWSRHFGDASSQSVGGVALDASRNVFMVGRTVGTVNFGTGPLTGNGVYLVKFAP